MRDIDQESAREHLTITEGLGKLGADGRQGRKKGCTSEENHREGPRRQRTWRSWECAVSVGRQRGRSKGRGGMARPRAGANLSEPAFDSKSICFVLKAKGQWKILGKD